MSIFIFVSAHGRPFISRLLWAVLYNSDQYHSVSVIICYTCKLLISLSSWLTPGFTGLLPDASRGLLTSNIERNNQSYGVGEVQHTLLFISEEGVRTKCFYLVCIVK